MASATSAFVDEYQSGGGVLKKIKKVVTGKDAAETAAQTNGKKSTATGTRRTNASGFSTVATSERGVLEELDELPKRKVLLGE